MATSMDEDPQPTSNEESRLAFLNGFTAMPLNMAASSMVKYIYFRPYKLSKQRSSTNDSSEIDYRTLYVTNLALNCTERDLTALFGVCGTIESIRYGFNGDITSAILSNP
jgi:RNA recognition motif-containing protein